MQRSLRPYIGLLPPAAPLRHLGLQVGLLHASSRPLAPSRAARRVVRALMVRRHHLRGHLAGAPPSPSLACHACQLPTKLFLPSRNPSHDSPRRPPQASELSYVPSPAAMAALRKEIASRVPAMTLEDIILILKCWSRMRYRDGSSALRYMISKLTEKLGESPAPDALANPAATVLPREVTARSGSPRPPRATSRPTSPAAAGRSALRTWVPPRAVLSAPP